MGSCILPGSFRLGRGVGFGWGEFGRLVRGGVGKWGRAPLRAPRSRRLGAARKIRPQTPPDHRRPTERPTERPLEASQSADTIATSPSSAVSRTQHPYISFTARAHPVISAGARAPLESTAELKDPSCKRGSLLSTLSTLCPPCVQPQTPQGGQGNCGWACPGRWEPSLCPPFPPLKKW